MQENTHVYAGEPDARQSREPIQTSRFRPQYRPLSPEEKALHDKLKDAAAACEQLIEQTPPSRERSLAITKLEEAIMWAVKGLTATPPAPPAATTRTTSG